MKKIAVLIMALALPFISINASHQVISVPSTLIAHPELPFETVIQVLDRAVPVLNAESGISWTLDEAIQKYYEGTISIIQEDSDSYAVKSGGSGVLVTIEDF